MSRLFLAIVAAVGLGLGSASASGDGPLKAYIGKLNAQVAKAFKTKDSKFFDSLLADDFQARDEHGVVRGRKETLFVLRFQLNTLRVLDYKVTTQSIKLEKARGTVVSTAKMVGITPARRGQPGRKVEIVRRLSDVYERRGNAWVLVYRRELAAPTTKTLPSIPLVPANRRPKDGR
jgi:hypothetical protein